jgi:hypothetical protein
VVAGLTHLAVSGRVGFDLVDQAWFHPELPLDPGRAEGDNPRLVAARGLVEACAILRDGDGWRVRSDDDSRWVRPGPSGLQCSCL